MNEDAWLYIPMKPTEGNLNARGLRFGIVVSKFNELVTSRLEVAALEALKKQGASENNLHIVRVPGAFEIPLVAKQLAHAKQFDAVICLGAVIRGETPHFDFISAEMSSGIARASMDTGIPVIFGVLTTNTAEEALARAGTTEVNRGTEAAYAAIEMATLMKELHAIDHKPTGFRHD